MALGASAPTAQPQGPPDDPGRAAQPQGLLDDPVAAWRKRAVDAYSLVLCVVHGLSLLAGIPAASLSAGHAAFALTGWLLTICAALLRRLPVPMRVGFLVLAVWVFAAFALHRGGVFLAFRLPLAMSPLMVFVLAGVRPGLVVGGLNLVALVTAFLATEAGWLMQAPPPWLPGEGIVQSAIVTGALVPQLLLLAWFSHHLATSMRREHRAAAQLRAEAADRERLESEVLEAGERESRRIGNDLHDGVCQDLTGLLLRSKRAEKALRAQDRPEAETLRGIVEGLGEAIGEIHALSRRLSPGPLSDRDLAGALGDLVKRTAERADVRVVFQATGEGALGDPRTAIQLYRIAQEALSNAVRHAGAGQIDVSLRREPGETVLRVDDDGRGLPADAPAAVGLGLRTMRWRAERAGGVLTIAARPGGGTRVECRVPANAVAGGEPHGA